MAHEQESQRLQELGDFLRTRRARLAPDLKVNVYTPLDEAETAAKLSRLLSERASVSSAF